MDKSRKDRVLLFHCVEAEELTWKVALQFDLIHLQSINWRSSLSLYIFILSFCILDFGFMILQWIMLIWYLGFRAYEIVMYYAHWVFLDFEFIKLVCLFVILDFGFMKLLHIGYFGFQVYEVFRFCLWNSCVLCSFGILDPGLMKLLVIIRRSLVLS